MKTMNRQKNRIIRKILPLFLVIDYKFIQIVRLKLLGIVRQGIFKIYAGHFLHHILFDRYGRKDQQIGGHKNHHAAQGKCQQQEQFPVSAVDQ